MVETKALTLTEIEQRYPNQWVLVEETAWDAEGIPVRGIIRFHSQERQALSQSLREIRRESPQVKIFIFYTGEKIPHDLTVVL